MDSRKYWNGSVRGLTFAVLQLIPAVIRRILDKVVTALTVSGLGSVGYSVSVQSGLLVRCPSNISLGNNVQIGRNFKCDSELVDGYLHVRDGCQINSNVTIDMSGGVEIGERTLLSDNVIVFTHSHGLNPRSAPEGMKLDIGSDVWIGSHVIITERVSKVGKNSIIGAGSVVVKDVPPNTVVAGAPAKVVRYLRDALEC